MTEKKKRRRDYTSPVINRPLNLSVSDDEEVAEDEEVVEDEKVVEGEKVVEETIIEPKVEKPPVIFKEVNKPKVTAKEVLHKALHNTDTQNSIMKQKTRVNKYLS